MKSLANFRGGRAILSAGALFLLSASGLLAQSGPVVSAVPGHRSPNALPAAGKDGIPLTLDQAIGLALANNQDLNVTVNAAEASQFNLFANYGIYDPLLRAYGTRTHNEQPTASQLAGAIVLKTDLSDGGGEVSQLTPWGGTFTLGFAGNRTKTNSAFYDVNPSFTAGLTAAVDQPLLRNFGKLATNWLIETARNTRDSAYQDFVRSVQATVNSTEQAYWDLAYAYDNLKVKQEAKRLAVELNRITKIKIDVGSLAPIDIVQTEADMATADQDIINAEGLIGQAQDQLKRLLNFDPTVWSAAPIVPTDPVRVEQQVFDLEQGVTTALERRPEIISQRYNVASGEIRYAYYQDQVLPNLNLLASYGNSGLDGLTTLPGGTVVNGGFGGAVDQVFARDFKNWKVGLVFSYPILNRQARGARGVAQYSLETQKAQLTVIQQDIIVGVRNAHRAIDTASKQIVAAAKGRELAERNLDAARKKYDNGMTTSFEVSKITNDLSDARTRELNALVIYRKAVSAYHNQVADILEWKGVRIEGMPEMSPPPAEVRADLVRTALQATAAAP
jgi:outer membrane protein TolC